jgi:septal ring factor EnvC (AmiA/AmiB activator)
MPIPLIIAVGAALLSAAGAGAGVAIYKNDEYNKAQKKWQDEKDKLQKQLVEYQNQLRIREKRISELQQELAEKTKQLEKTTRKLYETDRMIETLEQRHKELESFVRKFISIILFRYGKHMNELSRVVDRIADNQEEKNRILASLTWANKQIPLIEAKIKKETQEEHDYGNKINSIKNKLKEMES